MITGLINATLIDANGQSEKGAGTVYIDSQTGKLLYAGQRQPRLRCDTYLDVEGYAVMPALCDTHTHLRDPGYTYKESMETGMRAAIAGGYATLCAMANTNPVCDTAELVKANHEKAKKLGLCTLMQAAAAGLGLRDEVHTDYASLSKVTNVITNDGNTIFNAAFMEKLLAESANYGFVISSHCQPERKIVERDIELQKRVGGNLHIGHISHRQTVDMIRKAKREGQMLSCEATPHHLFGYDCDYRVNPPLRERQDVEALIDGVKNGIVDCLCTDHAPHSEEDKLAGMAGISNIEYALQIFLKVFHDNGIPLTRLSRMASYNTARRLGYTDRGLLKEGMRADIIVADTECESRIVKDNMISRSHNTPFDGRTVRGKVIKTFIGGELLYDNGRFIR